LLLSLLLLRVVVVVALVAVVVVAAVAAATAVAVFAAAAGKGALEVSEELEQGGSGMDSSCSLTDLPCCTRSLGCDVSWDFTPSSS
jgi:archaellin